MKVHVTLVLESKKDHEKLNAIMALVNGESIGAVADKASKRKAGRAFNDALANSDMVEELSPAEVKALDLAMKRAHEKGETPFADSLGFNRAEEIRAFVRDNPGKFTVAQMATIMHQCYPDVSRDRWIASGHAMCNPKQASYSLGKRDGKLIPIH